MAELHEIGYVPRTGNNTSQAEEWLAVIVNCIKGIGRTSLVVQWSRLRASAARGMASIPGGGTKSLCAARLIYLQRQVKQQRL